MQILVNETVEALRSHGFTVNYVTNKEEARRFVLNHIPPNATVGIGGSMTLREIGLVETLQKRGNILYDHAADGLTADEAITMRRKQMTSDVFICSVNAITKDGILVNIDGVGNRINAMNFGPKKVIIVAGVNKITNDVASALYRVRNIAAPRNARRLGLKLPCVKNDRCIDCNSPNRICRSILIMERRPYLTDITIVIVGEKLGY